MILRHSLSNCFSRLWSAVWFSINQCSTQVGQGHVLAHSRRIWWVQPKQAFYVPADIWEWAGLSLSGTYTIYTKGSLNTLVCAVFKRGWVLQRGGDVFSYLENITPLHDTNVVMIHLFSLIQWNRKKESETFICQKILTTFLGNQRKLTFLTFFDFVRCSVHAIFWGNTYNIFYKQWFTDTRCSAESVMVSELLGDMVQTLSTQNHSWLNVPSSNLFCTCKLRIQEEHLQLWGWNTIFTDGYFCQRAICSPHINIRKI